MNKIRDGLWITDIASISLQDTSDFDVVVSVCQDNREDNVECPYYHVNLADGPISAREWGGKCDYATFRRAAAMVGPSYASGDNTLVHCHSGQNRSAAVCAAVLAVEHELTYDEAIEEVRDAREIANPTEQMEEHARRFIEDTMTDTQSIGINHPTVIPENYDPD